LTNDEKSVTEDNVFLNFVREMRANQKSDSFNSMADRLVAEKKVMCIMTELKNDGFTIQETIDDSAGYDWAIRKATDEFIVVFRYEQTGFTIPLNDVVCLSNILRVNSVSKGVIVTWLLADDFPSVAFTNFDLNKFTKSLHYNPDFRQKVKPLGDCVKEAFAKPANFLGEVGGSTATELAEDRTAVKNIFSDNLHKSFNTLKAQTFKLDYKKKALEQLSEQDLNEIEAFSLKAIEEPTPKGNLEGYLKKITARMETDDKKSET